MIQKSFHIRERPYMTMPWGGAILQLKVDILITRYRVPTGHYP